MNLVSIKVEYTAPAKAGRAHIELYSEYPGSTIWFDDLYLGEMMNEEW